MLGEYSTTTTVSCGETGDDGMDGVVSEVTTGELIEEEEAEVDKAVDVSHESLVLLPPEEGANITFPATPLGKKVVTEGREEGPDEGEAWRLAVSRRRRRSRSDEARLAELCALAKHANNYFINPIRVAEVEFWDTDGAGYLVPPAIEGFAKWIKDSKVTRRDVDSLTSEAGLYGVVPHLSCWFPTHLRKASVHIKIFF